MNLPNLLLFLEKNGWKNISLNEKGNIISRDKFYQRLKLVNQNTPVEIIKRAINSLLDERRQVGLKKENEEVFEFIMWGFKFNKYGVNFIDFSELNQNEFTYLSNFYLPLLGGRYIKLELVLFINHLPLITLVTGESKREAFQNFIDTYKPIEALHKFNFINILKVDKFYFLGGTDDKINDYIIWRENLENLLLPRNILTFFQQYIAFRSFDSKKIIARYYQYDCTNSILKTVRKQNKAKEGGGIIWHTTGSGKSLTMLFSIRRILNVYPQATFFLITDRTELNWQLWNFFTDFPSLLSNDKISFIKKTKELALILNNRNQGKVIFTTIEKFSPLLKIERKCFNNPYGIFVFVDEAHRTHNLRQKKDQFSYALELRKIVPSAHFFGWTGTPIDNKTKSSYIEFGEIIHRYDTSQALVDQIIIDEIVYDFYPLKTSYQQGETRNREIVDKIRSDFNLVKKNSEFTPKFLLVARNRKSASKLLELFFQEKNFSDNIYLIITPFSLDEEKAFSEKTLKEINKTEENLRKFKYNDSPSIAIVVGKLTTGFNLPNLCRIYLDKKIDLPHELWQKISRVNRRIDGKEFGHIIDFAINKRTLEQAKEKYFSGENLGTGIISSEEKIKNNLKKLLKLLKLAEISDGLWETKGEWSLEIKEEMVSQLIKNNKEKEFIEVNKSLKKIVILPNKQILKTDAIFFRNCQEVVSIFNKLKSKKITDEREEGGNSFSSGNHSYIYDGETQRQYAFKENYHRIYMVLEKSNKILEVFKKWKIESEATKKLSYLVIEYDQRKVENFDYLLFQQKLETNFQAVEKQYEIFQKNLREDSTYLLKYNLKNYLDKSGKLTIKQSQLFTENFVFRLKKIFEDDPNCFWKRQWGDRQIEKLFDRIWLGEYNLPSFKKIEEKIELRKNTISFLETLFYDLWMKKTIAKG